jgi:rhodanese-related sulfurtransferase
MPSALRPDLITGPEVAEGIKYKQSNPESPNYLLLPLRQEPHQHGPPKGLHMTGKTIAVVNASGRQAASFIRVASAVGYKVRAQLRNLDGIVANEISSLANVTVLVGELYSLDQKAPINATLIRELFKGAQLAFINTTFWGDEVAIGKYIADVAKGARIQHYIYSSMPDHSSINPAWPHLPLWTNKFAIENYIRDINLPATFVYTGVYNNNFTSLPYPLFCMALQRDGSFTWKAPFHPDVKLPWLDAEHDVGPAVLQLFKDGPRVWAGQRIALAYEMLSPREACILFSRGIGRSVRYVRGPIEITVPIPAGYRDQLMALEALYDLGNKDPNLQPSYFGSKELENSCPEQALSLWEGYRGLEEYAREVFPLEEAANGLTWMNETDDEDMEGDDDDSDVLTMGTRKEEEWLA